MTETQVELLKCMIQNAESVSSICLEGLPRTGRRLQDNFRSRFSRRTNLLHRQENDFRTHPTHLFAMLILEQINACIFCLIRLICSCLQPYNTVQRRSEDGVVKGGGIHQADHFRITFAGRLPQQQVCPHRSFCLDRNRPHTHGKRLQQGIPTQINKRNTPL